MREDIKFALYLIVLGASMVVYAHSSFATKSTVEKMDDRIYQIWTVIVEKNSGPAQGESNANSRN